MNTTMAEATNTTKQTGSSRSPCASDIMPRKAMVPRRHLVFHAIPAATILAVVAVALSGTDSGGDLPGLLRLLVVVLSVALWSLVFSVSMLVHAVRTKRWRFLWLAVPLLVARIVYFSEIAWGNAEDHMYLWLPVEYILFYLSTHADAKLAKFGFVAITAVLYGLCYVACAITFTLL